MFSRTVALLSILFFTSTFYLVPSAHAVEEALQAGQGAAYQPDGQTATEKLANTLQAIKERVAVEQATIAQRMFDESTLWQDFLALFGLSGLATEDLQGLASMAAQAELLHQTALEEFAQVEADLLARGLPASILQRHQATVAEYQARYLAFKSGLDQALAAASLADQSGAVDALDEFLESQQFKRKQQEFDPNDLPNQKLLPDQTPPPRSTRDEFIQGGLQNTPSIRLAALGDFSFDGLQDASDPAYLSESDEIVLTQAIRDKAAELNHDTVTIYHWVRNNVEWVPGWGAAQSADLTLGSLRGNAMDIASLTIALLRASQIPARYVHGTIDVPIDAYKNWMGGFSDLEAAANYASSNGIPSLAMISGGLIDRIRMEHVWVEAATDFEPSRGAVNREADSWVALDPSFKQYEYLEGVDVEAVAAIDGTALFQDLAASGTRNEAEGWASGFDFSALAAALAQAEQSLGDFVANNLTDPTYGDLVGGRRAIVRELPVLPTALPNPVIVAGARYDRLPTSLQQRITWGLGRDLFGQPQNPVSLPFARVNNEKVTLSFRAATDADQAVLNALVPEGGITDLSQLPTSIPSYLVNVVPELKLDGELISTGGSMNLGQEIDLVTLVQLVGRTTSPRSYSVIAGSYLAVNAYSQGVSRAKIQQVRDRLEATRQIFESGQDSQLATLTRQQLLGDMFHLGGLAYYTLLTTFSGLIGTTNQAQFGLVAGTGTIGHEPNVDTFFGIPRAITQGGVAYDIPIYQSTASHDGDADRAREFTLQVGRLSSILEHATPEQMFVAEVGPGDPPLDGISAMKALQKAHAQGQRIYQITQANRATALPNINHDRDTMSEITAALNANKIVVTHTDAVTVPGWRGAGYLILDPETGTGAYKISGGANGAYLIVAGMVLISLAITIGVFLAVGAPVGGALLAVGGGATVVGLLLFAAASFITAGIALVSGNLRLCSNALTAAWAALGILSSAVLPGVGGSIAATIGTAIAINDLNGQVCR